MADFMPGSEVYHRTGKRYIAVAPAGRGEDGEVWYSFPTQAVLDRTSIKTRAAGYNRADRATSILRYNRSALKSQLCVVKLHKVNASANTKKAEIECLERIQFAPSTVAASLPKILDSSTSVYPVRPTVQDFIRQRKHPSWVAMAIIPGCTVEQLIERHPEPVPVALVAHLTIRLHEVVRWLHEQSPPMAHMDLGLSNIMLDPSQYSQHDRLSLPGVFLIDFGMAYLAHGDPKEDGQRLYSSMSSLAELHTPLGWEEDASCAVRKDMIKLLHTARMLNYKDTKGIISQKEFRETFLGKLIEWRSSITREVGDSLRSQIEETRASLKPVSDEDVREALKNAVRLGVINSRPRLEYVAIPSGTTRQGQVQEEPWKLGRGLNGYPAL